MVLAYGVTEQGVQKQFLCLPTTTISATYAHTVEKFVALTEIVRMVNGVQYQKDTIFLKHLSQHQSITDIMKQMLRKFCATTIMEFKNYFIPMQV